MITLLVGHRGVGKTSLLQKLKSFAQDNNIKASFVDLDAEIEARTGLKIDHIFTEKGEAYFRSLEREVFAEVCANHRDANGPCYVALGAGFEVEALAGEGCNQGNFFIIWLRRHSDAYGRVFCDRPRLEKSMAPLEEFLLRKIQRDSRFESVCWQEFTLPEGPNYNITAVAGFFFNRISNLGGVLTVLPRYFKSKAVWENFVLKRLLWDVDFFELRDDLLSKEQIVLAQSYIPREKLIYSFRWQAKDLPIDKGLPLKSAQHKKAQIVQAQPVALHDWALELGAPPDFAEIVSLHERSPNESIQDCIKRLSQWAKPHRQLKLAIEIKDFSELIEGHQWQQQNADWHSFLPRSVDGHWQWYRQFMKSKTPLNFFCEGEGSAADQPTLYQWMATPSSPQHFAAVLGSPVQHSWTPTEHESFFAKKQMPVFAIEVNEQAWPEALKALTTLGLRAAAITSPLKLLAFQYSAKGDTTAHKFKSVNTLVWHEGATSLGTNTDIDGLKALFSQIPLGAQVAIWGGGGTLPLMRELLPDAISYSARSGQAKEQVWQDWTPDVVIWAAPQSDEKNILSPPQVWAPQKVIDLNYRQDSGGKIYAIACGAEYIAGDTMFFAQAKKQQQFWEKYL